MATESEGNTGAGPQAESTKLAAKGVRTTQDFANIMAALMSDVLSGDISTGRVNAAVNAGRQMLKSVELQLKYGAKVDATTGQRTLTIGTLPSAE